MKLLECYLCDGRGWLDFSEVVEVFDDGLYIETDCKLLGLSENTSDYVNCPDCLGKGRTWPW